MYPNLTQYEIDGTKLDKQSELKSKRYSHIIFNFPHVGQGIKDKVHNVIANQSLIAEFFVSAQSKLMDPAKGDENAGVIMVTVKTGDPYDSWNIKKLAYNAGLVCVRSFEFCPADYEGYAHRRTIGFKEGLSDASNAEITKNPARTWMFRKKDEAV
jgi:25S rRNA (uracil2634-N3)-methyltransferase